MNTLLTKTILSASAGLLCLPAIGQTPRNSAAPRVRNYSGAMAKQAKERGWTVLEGDIVIDKPAAQNAAVRPRGNSLTVASSSSLWPPVSGVATVYYVNANAGATDSVDEAANANIQTAVNTFNGDFTGLIQWVQTTPTSGVNYVLINLNQYDYSGECEAAEGYEAEKAQPMTGSAQCAVGTILHEMGHIIGLWHEQSRPDASNYITVNYNNAIKGSWGNFETITQNAQTLGLYDYASVMQYPPYSFSRNGGPVIETIPAGMPLANVEGVPVPASADYSAGDKEAIERLYGAPPTQVTITSNPTGLQVMVDGSNITTPQTFTWALNSKHTLDVATGLQMLSGDIEASTTSATFYYTYGRWNDNGAQSHTITVLPGDGGVGFPSSGPQVATYSANFIQLVPYTSAVYPSGVGSVGISPTPQTYSGSSNVFLVARQQATLTAAANAGWNFFEFNNGPFWLPGGLGANPKTFYVPDTGNPIDTTAEFSNTPVYTVDVTPETFSSNLSVDVDGDFWYTPVNFSHFYDYDGQPTPTWTAGSTHTLNFSSPELPYSINSRYAFSKWSDNGTASHSIASLPATATSYVATVIPQFAPATNFSYPPCGGTGTLMPASPTNDGFYPTGTQLTYSATPGTDWTFAGWTFDLSGTTTPAMLTANDETLVFANFNIANAPLTLTNLSPNAADSGGSGFTMTLFGTGFSPDSVVGITSASGTSYPTVTFVNSGEITIPITSVQIAAPGNFQVYVENFPPGSNGCAVFGYQTFLIHATTLATSTTLKSSANPAVNGSPVTFTATVSSSESNAAGTVTFKNGSTLLGNGTLNSSGVATYTTSSLAGGTNSITAAYGGDGNNSSSTSGTLVQTVDAPAVMSTPAANSTLTSASATFTWTAGTGVTQYILHFGTTGVGSSNLGNSGALTTQSYTLSNIPTTGGTLYVRLYSQINGAFQYSDYTYTEWNSAMPAVMSTPAPGSTLSSSSATFTWTAGTGVTQYLLHFGTTGVGSSNLANSGSLTTQTYTLSGIPTTGGTLYVRLYSLIKGAWQYNDYMYTEWNSAMPAVMSTPAPGSALSASSATFTWTAGSGVSQYLLHFGTTGVGSSNLANSGSLTTRSYTLSGIPTTGGTLYVRLYSYISGAWQYNDYTYTEWNSATPAVMVTPTPGSTLAGSSATFTWTTGSGVSQYLLHFGTTGVGSSNLANSGSLKTQTYTLSGIPTTGGTLYVRLYSYISGAWQYNDYAYTTGAARSYVGYVYTLNSDLNSNGTGNISGYTEAQGTGALTLLGSSPYNTGLNNPVSMAMDVPMGLIFAVGSNGGSQGSGMISSMPINENTGALSAAVLTTPSAVPTAVAVGPYGRFVFVSSHQGDTVTVYSVASNGTLTQIAGSPYTIPGANCGAFCIPSADQMVYDAAAQTLYVDSSDGWFVTTFTVNSTTGALTYVYNEETSSGPTGLAVNPSGSFLYVDAGADTAVNAFSVTTAAMLNGVPEPITTIAGQPFPAGNTPLTAVVEPTGHSLYVDNNGTNNISAYSINQSSGALTQLTGSPFAISGGSTNPQQIAVDGAGQYLYVASESYSQNQSGGVTAYSIASGTGALTQVNTTPYSPGSNAAEPFQVAVYPLP